ncbi:uncharacterized protein LOC110821609 [Carica papaya]|uniref:uncharacterized protein LOC110821609 n=1 Tax=Carica papaya TaxID=3649 RepID=UPI000B8D0325|nr:uncharacterized protein LOC110821609 [Carica papaya]
MDGVMQIGIPILGIAAAAVITFYAVSFAEIREKSFRDLEEAENGGGFKSSLSSRERRAKRKADKQARS